MKKKKHKQGKKCKNSKIFKNNNNRKLNKKSN